MTSYDIHGLAYDAQMHGSPQGQFHRNQQDLGKTAQHKVQTMLGL